MPIIETDIKTIWIAELHLYFVLFRNSGHENICIQLIRSGRAKQFKSTVYNMLNAFPISFNASLLWELASLKDGILIIDTTESANTKKRKPIETRNTMYVNLFP